MPHPSDSRSLALLPPGYRVSGLLLHVTSLPSRYGIGDLGPEAHAWIARLAAAGQSWWQMLPLGPTGYGDSPYNPLSTFAGNPLLISPDRLVEDGLINRDELWCSSHDPARVHFEEVRQRKRQMLDSAWRRFAAGNAEHLRPAYERFRAEQTDWLDDFALFISIKEHFGGAYYLEWPEPLAKHEPKAVAEMANQLRDRIDFTRFVQFLFFRQWWHLKQHASELGVRLLGDLPFFVSGDSAEVWAQPELFMLDKDRRPKFMAGVPPDYFSATGQLWGNPTYDWPHLQSTEYRWWVRRLAALLQLVDGIRLDHFRAFAAAWHVAAGSKTAEKGEWIECPGTDLFAVIRDTLGGLPFIAEDLGLITEDVRELRDQFGMPGMRVLQFAFDGDPENIFLPQHYNENSSAFSGTHDNNTSRGWFKSLDGNAMSAVKEFFGDTVNELNIAPAMLETIWKSKSALAIAPLQDVLNLDESARMNVPGVAQGNWEWRVTNEQLDHAPFDWLRQLTATSGRLP